MGTRKPLKTPVKRECVRKIHTLLMETMKQLNIRCVRKTIGLRIVRVCCRTTGQILNIVPILTQMVIDGLVEEVGMPLDYSHRMKSLVLYFKPSNIVSSMQIEYALEHSEYGFVVSTLDSICPSETIKKSSKQEMKHVDMNVPEVFQEATDHIESEETTEISRLRENAVLSKKSGKSLHDSEKNANNQFSLTNDLKMTLHFIFLAVLFIALILSTHSSNLITFKDNEAN